MLYLKFSYDNTFNAHHKYTKTFIFIISSAIFAENEWDIIRPLPIYLLFFIVSTINVDNKCTDDNEKRWKKR